MIYGHSNKLYKFIKELNYSDIPELVIHKAKQCLIDFFGVVLAGSKTNVANIAKKTALRLYDKSEATIIGSINMSSCSGAALVNSIAGHSLELDDGNRFAMGHPGVTVIPAVLALGEYRQFSGKDILLSIIIGYETFSRLGRAVRPNHFERGFHPTGTCGTFAAAAACSKLLNHSEEQIANSFGLAGSQASGLFEFLSNGSMAKQLNTGHAAKSGLESAILADEGFTGPPSVLEGPRGFLQAFTDTRNPEELSQDLGTKFHITEAYIKLHSACRHIHTSIDAALKLRSENIFKLEDIEKITVDTYKEAAKLNNIKINTPLSARMSLPFCVAVALVKGQVGLWEFKKENLDNLEIKKLMNKIEVHYKEELQKLVPKFRPSHVKIKFKNGEEKFAEIKLSKGEPENPVSDRELHNKFLMLSEPSLKKNYAEILLNRLLEIEKESNIRNILIYTKEHLKN